MESRLSFLRRCLGAALVYGVVYATLRELSLAAVTDVNWIPVAGLRFACLLLVPTRYWPALVMGEAVALGYENYQCLSLFGLPWTVVASVPRMLYIAPLVYAMRKQLPNREKGLSDNIVALLLCIFLASVASALHGVLNYSLLKQLAPGEQPVPLWMRGSQVIISNYLSMLTMTPVALWIAGWSRAATFRQLKSGLFLRAFSDAQWRGACTLLAVIAVLVVVGDHVSESMHELVLCGMLAALTTAAWRYGWQCAALVGAAANMGVIMLATKHDDLGTVQMQCIIAIIMSGLLLLGVRTTSERLSAQRERMSRRLARRELFTIERNRLAYACVLDNVFSNTRKQTMRMMHTARTALPSGSMARHYQQFDFLHQEHQRLTAGMSPRAWWQFGGPDGAIAQALEEIGISCEIGGSQGAEVFRLPTELSIAIYRLSCEAALYLVKQSPSDHVYLSLDVLRGAHGWVRVSVTLESIGRPLAKTGDTYERLALEQLQLSLGASGLNEQALRNRAQLYGGDVQIMQTASKRLRIVLSVADHAAP